MSISADLVTSNAMVLQHTLFFVYSALPQKSLKCQKSNLSGKSMKGNPALWNQPFNKKIIKT
jgi:hypothetical protein